MRLAGVEGMRAPEDPAVSPLPPRPYLPPVCGGAVSAFAVCMALLACAWRGYCAKDASWLPLQLVVPVPCAGLVVAGVSYAGRRTLPEVMASWLVWAGIATTACSLACALWVGGLQSDAASLTASASAYAFEVVSDASVGSFGVSCTAIARDETGSAVARVRLTTPEAYEPGQRLHVVGRVERFDDSDWARSRFMAGEVASVDAVRVVRAEEPTGFDPVRSVRAAALRVIDPSRSPGRALVAGTVCGAVTDLNQTDASDSFAATGLSHLVAVSGSHLALISALADRVLVRLQVRRGTRFAVMGCASVLYVCFTGCAPSAVRSAIMVCLTMTAQGGGRRGHGLSTLALSVLGFSLVNPGIVYSLGFQLSVASVLFIGLFGSYVTQILERLGLPRCISEALALTLVAQWATVPQTVPVFGQLSLVAPLANLIVGPLMTALLICGLGATGLGVLIGASWPVALPEGIGTLSIFTADALSRLPLASIAVASSPVLLGAFYVLAVLIFAFWPDPSRLQIALSFGVLVGGAGVWLCYWLFCAPASLTVLDVGQADAILVRDGPQAVLVDAGVDDHVVEALARNHVYRLDAVVVTHWDSDHWGGLPSLLKVVDVGRVLVASGAAEHAPDELGDVLDAPLAEVVCGDVIHVGGFACEVVWPRSEVAGTENGDSLVLSVTYDGERVSDEAKTDTNLTALLTGDTEADQEHMYAEAVGDIDVLKLGHHGSAASVDDEVLDILRPELAVASAGESNRYGHPTQECIDAIERAGARFACTKDVGDVRIEPRDSGYVVKF